MSYLLCVYSIDPSFPIYIPMYAKPTRCNGGIGVSAKGLTSLKGGIVCVCWGGWI